MSDSLHARVQGGRWDKAARPGRTGVVWIWTAMVCASLYWAQAGAGESGQDRWDGIWGARLGTIAHQLVDLQKGQASAGGMMHTLACGQWRKEHSLNVWWEPKMDKMVVMFSGAEPQEPATITWTDTKERSWAESRCSKGGLCRMEIVSGDETRERGNVKIGWPGGDEQREYIVLGKMGMEVKSLELEITEQEKEEGHNGKRYLVSARKPGEAGRGEVAMEALQLDQEWRVQKVLNLNDDGHGADVQKDGEYSTWWQDDGPGVYNFVLRMWTRDDRRKDDGKGVMERVAVRTLAVN